jgi:hypothetical protein
VLIPDAWLYPRLGIMVATPQKSLPAATPTPRGDTVSPRRLSNISHRSLGVVKAAQCRPKHDLIPSSDHADEDGPLDVRLGL